MVSGQWQRARRREHGAWSTEYGAGGGEHGALQQELRAPCSKLSAGRRGHNRPSAAFKQASSRCIMVADR